MSAERETFGEEIVHIIPLGFEIDRATKPFTKYKANRVYLLSVVESNLYDKAMLQRQHHYLDIVTKELDDKGIEVIFKNTDTFNLLEVMDKIAKIIRLETKQKNRVYVNMSAVGRLTSLGATLAAMHHGAQVYYVVADDYSKTEEETNAHGLSICNKLQIQFIENLKFLVPDVKSQKVLAELCRKETGMRTNQIIDFLRKEKVEGFGEEFSKMQRPQKINYKMKLNKGILDKLENEGYITRERIGKNNTIRITESGKYIAYLSGTL